MSLLFDQTQWVESAFTVQKIPERGRPDAVLVGNDLWKSITTETDNDRICISIAPHRQSSRHKNRPLRALSCWAMLDEETTELAIPPKWLKVYDHIFSEATLDNTPPQKSLNVTAVQPILLTEIIVTALSRDAYHVARGRDSPLENWFSDDHPILRHGSIHTFSSDLLPLNGHDSARCKLLQYRLDMLDPVLQGYAQKGGTRFVVTLGEFDTDGDAFKSEPDAEEDSESDKEGIEIDEGFLANSIQPSIFSSPTPATPVLYDNGSTNVAASPTESSIPSLPSGFRTEPLSELVSPLWDDCTLYLRTADLSRVGVLNGDWAVSHSSDASPYRLVRIAANDGLVQSAGIVTGSPILLHNICSEFSSLAPMSISLQTSPFGSGQPAIPTARTVTLARVASPLSTDRTYQPLFLRSLKVYFDGMKRLVKQGDVIAVGIDTDALLRIRGSDSEAGDTADAVDQDVLDHNYPASPVRANEVVFFVITNVEYDVPSNDVNASSPDMYIGSTIGELGCWVDSAFTHMVQAGVEHSRVPDVGTYMGLGPRSPRALFATLASQSFSHLLGPESSFGKILSLSSATLVRHAVDYNLHLSVLLKGARGTGKFTVACWVAQRLNIHLLEINCYDIIGENDAKTEGTLRARFDKASACSPCILVLRYIDALAQTTQVLETGKEPVLANVLRECVDHMQQTWKITGFPVIVFGTTSEPARVPMGILSCFKHEVTFEVPGEPERYEILNSLTTDAVLAPDVSLSSLATQTAALVASDLVDLVGRAKFTSMERVIRITECKETHLAHAGIPLTAADFDISLGRARASYSESIGAPKIPNVSWDDVGGLAHVKSDILDTIQLPLEHPELFADGLKKRSGILLYGPPGTGKTLLAKAVATSCSLNFFSIKGPELLNMYIGESEANVRRVFQRARDAKPCVIFFDELDSVAPKRGNHGDSGGVMDRIVSQLLAELDGMSAGTGGADVFVIGATNRPDLLDPALLRPGRFDRMLYLGVSETHNAQLNILEALTRKFRLNPDLDLRHLAEQCPFNYTGADFYALCSDAMLNAMSRKAEGLETKIAHLNRLPGQHGHPYPLTPQYYLAEMASADDMDVLVSHQDFDLALHDLVPSVSQSEMDHYAMIQRRFSQELMK